METRAFGDVILAHGEALRFLVWASMGSLLLRGSSDCNTNIYIYIEKWKRGIMVFPWCSPLNYAGRFTI